MKQLSPKGLKYLKIVHLLFVVMWTGGAMALVVMLCFTHPTTPEGLYIRSRCVQLVDDFLIIPGGIGLLLTGIVYGVWSKWGFFKHNWITVKWSITLFMTILGAFALGTWVNNNVYAVEEINDYITHQEPFTRNVNRTIFWGSVQVVGLCASILISILKPWKKKGAK